MACYAGQSVGAIKRVQPAAEIVAELMTAISVPANLTTRGV
jgi:hypothetical protein